MRRRSEVAVGVLALLVAAGPVAADVVTINFDDLPGMPNTPGDTIPTQSQLSDHFANLGVLFSSGESFVAVVDLGQGHATSGTNGIGGSRPPGILTYDAAYPIEITFVDPENPYNPAVTNFVSVRGDFFGSGKNVTLSAYDLNGQFITSTTVPDSGGVTLSITTPGIHFVRFVGTTDEDGVALDDLRFNDGPTTRAPALSHAALLILLLSLVSVGVIALRGVRRIGYSDS